MRSRGFLLPPLTPLWVSPGALWMRSRCYVYVFWRPLDIGPVSVLFGEGRDVRSVHACACFVKVRLVKKDCLFRPSWGSRARIKEARRDPVERERHPEWHQRRSTVTKMVPKPPGENQQNTREMSINTWENVKSRSGVFVGSGRARGRPRLSREGSRMDFG